MDQELKAYLDERFEAMRGDLRLIAEAVMGLASRQEVLQAETVRGLQEVKAMLPPPSYEDLNDRARSLEAGIQCLDRRFRILEGKAHWQTQDVLDAIRQKFGKPQA